MSVFSLFSHRKRLNRGEMPDILVYDNLPESLRVQIVHIWNEVVGPYYVYTGLIEEDLDVVENNEGWKLIHDVVAREHGIFRLGSQPSIADRCINYLMSTREVDAVLDLLEVGSAYIDRVVRSLPKYERKRHGIRTDPDAAIKELHERFRRAGIGYRFESGQIIQVDSEFIHSEVVKPALLFLSDPDSAGARAEFMNAHSHYKTGEMKDAIVDANNAFESTMKTICELRGWPHPRRARASDLLRVLREKGLLPNCLDNSFDQLAATLRSGLPRVRGEEGAHGQGSVPRETPDYVAGYALNLAAVKILFLAQAHEALG